MYKKGSNPNSFLLQQRKTEHEANTKAIRNRDYSEKVHFCAHLCCNWKVNWQNQNHEMLFYQTLRTCSTTVAFNKFVSGPAGKTPVKHSLQGSTSCGLCPVTCLFLVLWLCFFISLSDALLTNSFSKDKSFCLYSIPV